MTARAIIASVVLTNCIGVGERLVDVHRLFHPPPASECEASLGQCDLSTQAGYKRPLELASLSSLLIPLPPNPPFLRLTSKNNWHYDEYQDNRRCRYPQRDRSDALTFSSTSRRTAGFRAPPIFPSTFSILQRRGPFYVRPRCTMTWRRISGMPPSLA